MDGENRVLIVEDNALTGEIIQSVIESAGASAIVCRNGATAIEMIGEFSYRVLIVDYRMRDMLGSEVVKAARRISPDIFIIGISLEQYREREFIEAGADVFLLKPFDVSGLVGLIERAYPIKKSGS